MIRKIIIAALTIGAIGIRTLRTVTSVAPQHWSTVSPRLIVVCDVYGSGLWLFVERNRGATWDNSLRET